MKKGSTVPQPVRDKISQSKQKHNEPNSQCFYCGKKFYRIVKKGRKNKNLFCTRECFNKGYTGKNSPLWNGGKIGRNYYIYERNARLRGIEFNLTQEYFEKLQYEECFYCGDKLGPIGVDRIDSDKGYSIENVVPCCKTCNQMKWNHSYRYFAEHVRKIAERIGI